MLGRSINLTTIFLGRLRPPKQLTNCPSYISGRRTKVNVARPGIEPRTSDLRVGCPPDCATRPSFLKCKAYVVNTRSNHITVVLNFFQYNPETSRQFSCLTAAKEDPPPRPPLPHFRLWQANLIFLQIKRPL